ncbi:Putative pH-response transcription factor [Podospora comata]|uniref:PH-response transcription factor n=1 Tax=Podospora comata TaxID=48703 RepID=A0ABY6SGM4_PODCO|nr:Putative pH-response transcription factor [Podospora comata]
MTSLPLEPLSDVITFPDTQFTSSYPTALLPSPAEVRETNGKTSHPRATNRNIAPPARYPELGLLVKYGTKVIESEMLSQRYVFQRLHGVVPVPAVLGWAHDDGQGFLYMTLIDAPTLAEGWKDLGEFDRQALCLELRGMVQSWRSLEQNSGENYIGAPDSSLPEAASDAVRLFQEACYIDLEDEVPIAFTHGNLVPCNILVIRGENPKVAAIIDWDQSGWYPSYWEWCKAIWVMMPPVDMDRAQQELWKQNYLPLILEPLSETDIYHPWFYFALSNL